MIQSGQLIVEQPVSHEDKINLVQLQALKNTSGWLTAIAMRTKYCKLLKRMVIKGDDEVSPKSPKLPDAIVKEHASLTETYEPIPILRVLRSCTYQQLLDLRTNLGRSGVCEENQGMLAISQVLKEKAWLGITAEQGVDGGVDADKLTPRSGHSVPMICYLIQELKKNNSSFSFCPENAKEKKELERNPELGEVSTASLEDKLDIRAGRSTLHEQECSAAPAAADLSDSPLPAPTEAVEDPSEYMESSQEDKVPSCGVQTEEDFSSNQNSLNSVEQAPKLKKCPHVEVLHGGGLGRETSGARSRRIEANQVALEILENFSDSEILANSNYLQEIAVYSGRGGTDVSHLNEYYTQQDIARFCWNVALRLGCYQGIALEPSCGTGNFIAEAPPTFMVKGVEVDPVSSRIAKLLYSERHSISCEAFQSFAPDCTNKFNLVIGNPPYGAYSIKDVRKDSFLYGESSGKLEQMFVLAAAELTLPDGLFIGVLPYSIVSGQDDIRKKFRNQVIQVGWDFLGAFRLPRTAHKGFGTEFITDIVILKKRSAENLSQKLKGVRQSFREGTFFEDNPQYILGEEGTDESRYGKESYTVFGDLTPEVWGSALKMVPQLKENCWRWKPPTAREKDVVCLDGRNYEFKNSRWHQLVEYQVDSRVIEDAIALLSDPHKLLSLDYEKAKKYLSLLQQKA